MRCAVYVRVSTEMETQKSSIAHQKNFFIKYIEDKGWTLYKIYQDRESGMSVDKRKGLRALIEDSNKGYFDVVLTKSISRFARNTLEGLQYIREFKRKNIRFITIEDAFDSKEYDEFMFTLLLSMAQRESEKISERIRFGKRERAKKGYFNGSNPPYGYKKQGNSLVPAGDITTEVVKLIFKMYLEGNGFYKITKYLNEKGYPTPSQILKRSNSSNLWHQSTVKGILCNEAYIGDMVQNKTRTKDILKGIRENNRVEEYIQVENTHKGIIPPEIFFEAQKVMKSRACKRSGINKHLFSNIIYCGECGAAMHYKKNRLSYLCGRQNKFGQKHCKGGYIREDDLRELLLMDIKKRIKENVSLKRLNDRLRVQLNNYKQEVYLKPIEKEIANIDKKSERLLDMLIDNIIDKEVYRRRKTSFDNQRQLLQEEKNRVQLKLVELLGISFSSADEIIEFISFDNITFRKLIDKIEVNKDKSIKVYYNFIDTNGG